MSAPAHSLPILEENKRLTIRWFEEVWNKARREAIKEMFAETCVLHDTDRDYRGPEEFAQFYDALRARFSQFSVKPILTLAEGDLAAILWSADFVETSTGKRIHLTGTSTVRCKDGQFVEAWQNWDQAGLAAQLAA
jgi:predicted SnoaL-like aldol condensation-catalyzing enzyme